MPIFLFHFIERSVFCLFTLSSECFVYVLHIKKTTAAAAEAPVLLKKVKNRMLMIPFFGYFSSLSCVSLAIGSEPA